MTEHARKMTRRENDWENRMADIVTNSVESTVWDACKCADCGFITDNCIKCDTCPRMLCWKCDEIMHTKMVLHTRYINDNQRRRFMFQNEFLNPFGKIFKKGWLN